MQSIKRIQPILSFGVESSQLCDKKVKIILYLSILFIFYAQPSLQQKLKLKNIPTIMSHQKMGHHLNFTQHSLPKFDNYSSQLLLNPSTTSINTHYPQNFYNSSYQNFNYNNNYSNIIDEAQPISGTNALFTKQYFNDNLQGARVMDENQLASEKQSIINEICGQNGRQIGDVNKPKVVYVESEIVLKPNSPERTIQNHSSNEQTQGQNLCSIQFSLDKQERKKNNLMKDKIKQNHYTESIQNNKKMQNINIQQFYTNKNDKSGSINSGGSLDLKQEQQFWQIGRFCSADNPIKKNNIQSPEMKKNTSQNEINLFKKTSSRQYPDTPLHKKITQNPPIQIKFAESASQQTIKQCQLNNNAGQQPSPFQPGDKNKFQILGSCRQINIQTDTNKNNMEEENKQFTNSLAHENINMNGSLLSSYNSFFKIPSIYTPTINANNRQNQNYVKQQRPMDGQYDLLENRQQKQIDQIQNADNKQAESDKNPPVQLYSFRGNQNQNQLPAVNNSQSLQNIEGISKSYSVITYSMNNSIRNTNGIMNSNHNIVNNKLKKTMEAANQPYISQQMQIFDQYVIQNEPITNHDPSGREPNLFNNQHNSNKQGKDGYIQPQAIKTANSPQQLHKSRQNSKKIVGEQEKNKHSLEVGLGKFKQSQLLNTTNIDFIGIDNRPTQSFRSSQPFSIQQPQPKIYHYDHFSSYQINPTYKTSNSFPIESVPKIPINHIPSTIFPNEIDYKNQRSILQTPIKTQQSYSIEYPSNKIGEGNSIYFPYSEDGHFRQYSPEKNTIQNSLFESNNSSKILQIKQLLQPSQTHQKKQKMIDDKNWYSQPKPSLHSILKTPYPKANNNVNIKRNIQERVSNGSHKKLKVTCKQSVEYRKTHRPRENTSQRSSRNINFGGILNKLDEYRKANGIKLSENLLDSGQKIYYKNNYSFYQEPKSLIQSNKRSSDGCCKQDNQTKIGRYIRLPNKQVSTNHQQKCTKRCYNILCRCWQPSDQPVINANKVRKINLVASSPQKQKSKNIGNPRQTNRVSLHIDPQIIQLTNPYKNQPVRLQTNPQGMSYEYQSERKDIIDGEIFNSGMMYSTGIVTNHSLVNNKNNAQNNFDSRNKPIQMKSYLLN